VSEILEYGDADEASDRDLALQIGLLLEKYYPNHPWNVGFQGRALVIKHLAIASEVMRILGTEGFCTLLPDSGTLTTKQLTYIVVNFAGALLEAFDLPRGAWDGRVPVVPKEWVRGQQRFN
jgi:hypothetical protein